MIPQNRLDSVMAEGHVTSSRDMCLFNHRHVNKHVRITKLHEIRIQLINRRGSIAFVTSTNFSESNLKYLVKLVSIDHL